MPSHSKPCFIFLLVTALSLPAPADAGWKDFLRELKENFSGEESTSIPSVTTLSQEEMINGLKEALQVATERAVDRLGRENGFLAHPQPRIPMPESLNKIEKLLRKLKQDELADEFVATLNHAAERTVGEGAGVFADAIRGMTLQDAAGILNGPDNAATHYFRQRTETPLTQRMQPIVSSATEATGVTRTYKRVLDKADFLARYMKPEETDLDAYITNRALNGLFHELALEEARIRKDPVARTTELLRKVFAN